LKKGSCYTLGYAGVLGSVCALLLTAASSFTAPYRDANADAEVKRNILDVLGVRYSPDVSSRQLLEVFEAKVKQEESAELTLYRYIPPEDSDEVKSVAVAFEGPGLWGPIKGFLALEPDMKTIRGLTFYEQEETPGLGGEIASVWFREQFKGRKITGDAGKTGIVIKPGGKASAINEVDAITGATMTCDKVEAILNDVIKKITGSRSTDG